MNLAARPTFRFAPTPNGALHLGHAYSALMNARLAEETGGRLLLRIEDTDISRCKREFETAILEDLAWLGIGFSEPLRRQSEHLDDYARALAALKARGLVFPCFCRRVEIARANGGLRDPDGAPLHRGPCLALSRGEIARREAAGERPALRLDTARALSELAEPLTWREFGEGARETIVKADPGAWGDVVLRGRDTPAAYHLAVVVDDASQGISDVVRGRDLYAATAIHRLLQFLLGLPAPRYRHHRLVLDAEGAKMSKSASSQPLRALREEGYSALEVRAALGFAEPSQSRLAVRFS
ncbi:MAG TPA: tRNA glutamyl-Q(34) synthetase GluQRS [Roseiarcus sp.]|nr:tRNA glutamyl-Q(34) synthetase GluQRS [Roseiarcus sp.]